jgi:MFS family permease
MTSDEAAPAAPNAAAPLPTNVRLLGLSSLLNDIASEMIFPLLPQFLLSVLGANKLQLGVIEGVADTTASLLKLFSGGWSDRAGSRKIFVVTGYSIACVVRPLMGLVAYPWQVLAIRCADRFGKGIRSAPRDAMIADETNPRNRGRAFGFNRAMDHLGAAIGPVLAWLFLRQWPADGEWALRTLFLLAIVPGVIVIVLVLFGLRERPLKTTAAKKFTLTLAPFDANFRCYLVALVIFTLGNSSDAFLLVRAGELGVSTPMLPLLWCAFHIVKSSGNLLAGRIVDAVGPRPLIFLGWIVYALIYLAFALADSAWQAWLFFLIYGVFFALTEPAERTLVANLVGPERTGLAYGWFNFSIGLAALPASVLFGWLYSNFGVLAAFGSSAALAMAAALVLALVRPSKPEAA